MISGCYIITLLFITSDTSLLFDEIIFFRPKLNMKCKYVSNVYIYVKNDCPMCYLNHEPKTTIGFVTYISTR